MSNEREAFEAWYNDPAREVYIHDKASAYKGWQAARQSAGASNACPHGVDDGACKQCYAAATGQEPIYEQRIEDRFEVSWRKVPKDRFDALPEDKRRIVYAACIGDTRADIEAEQRRKMQERFARRPHTPATEDFDLPASNDAVGDNGATLADHRIRHIPGESAIVDYPADSKREVKFAHYAAVDAAHEQVAKETAEFRKMMCGDGSESKRVELDDCEIHKLARQYLRYTDGDSEVYGTLAFARALFARAQAKGE